MSKYGMSERPIHIMWAIAVLVWVGGLMFYGAWFEYVGALHRHAYAAEAKPHQPSRP